MELEELKSAWAELDNRLKENKSMNKTLIMEMAKNKADKLISRFINQNIISVILLLLIIPLMLLGYNFFGGKFIFFDIFSIYMVAICFICFFWYIYKISGLMKIDFSKKISDNIYYTNRYNIQVNRETQATIIFIGPSLVILGILVYAETKSSIYLWVFFACTILAGIMGGYWGIKKHNKNINSILKSMNEIKALEEEE